MTGDQRDARYKVSKKIKTREGGKRSGGVGREVNYRPSKNV